MLAVGLDTDSMEMLKQSLKKNEKDYILSFVRDASDVESLEKKNFDAVFFSSNKQGPKVLLDIRKLTSQLPRSSLILITPRADHHLIINSFRAGVFDCLTLPIDQTEIRIVLNRLRYYDVIHSGQWTPERAVLHLFSRPENYRTIEDVSVSLTQYLNLFVQIEKHVFYASQFEVLSELTVLFKLTDSKLNKLRKFIKDAKGLIFGLQFYKETFHFVIKTGEGKYSYVQARNISRFQSVDIFSNYLSNVLTTSLTFLAESFEKSTMRMLSMTDEITGLFNQRKLLEDLEFYIAQYAQTKKGFNLLFIDIDYFKNVNDQFGHVIGSQILNDMTAVLKKQLRSNDLVYRYGGDEFIVLLPNSNIDESKRIATRISEAVKESKFSVGEGIQYTISLSIGIADFPNDAQTVKAIVEFADKMMYMSKKTGRGKVVHVSEVIG